ncbi:hypothetical protein PR003_g34830 [Phytophthora rubi]|uniref:Uncharacterized protein n=1 Tax=Phytophthora rubi TaxID=129364 RepID=A0A6A4AJ74_9STRA|nr:hypothetical protein PR003_g34830 [Phytophthora rubi]
MQGKPRVHAVHLRLPIDCCALFCVPPAPRPAAAAAPAVAAAALPGSMQGKPRVHAIHLRLPIDCCASFCVPPAPPGRKPSWPLQHRHNDQQRQRRQQHCRGR